MPGRRMGVIVHVHVYVPHVPACECRCVVGMQGKLRVVSDPTGLVFELMVWR